MTGPEHDPHAPRDLDAELRAIFGAPVQPRPARPGTYERILLEARGRRRHQVWTSFGAAAAAVAVLALGATLAGQVLGDRPDQQAGPAPTTASTRSATPTPPPTPTPSTPAPSTPATTTARPGALPADFAPLSVTFATSSAAYVLGSGSACELSASAPCAAVARSDDTGRTWSLAGAVPAQLSDPRVAPAGPGAVRDVRFATAGDGWLFGPALLSTHDAGATWTRLDLGARQVLDLAATHTTVYVVTATCTAEGACRDARLESAPAGTDDLQPVPGVQLAGSVRGGYVSSAASSLAVTLLGSADQAHVFLLGPGGGWRRAASPTCGIPARVLTTADDSGFFAACAEGAAGNIAVSLQTSPDGRSWQQVPSAVGPSVVLRSPYWSVTAATRSLLAASGGSTDGGGALLLSRDGGRTWTQAPTVTPANGWRWVGAGGGRRYLALTTDGQLYLSPDAGDHWERLLPAGS